MSMTTERLPHAIDLAADEAGRLARNLEKLADGLRYRHHANAALDMSEQLAAHARRLHQLAALAQAATGDCQERPRQLAQEPPPCPV